MRPSEQVRYALVGVVLAMSSCAPFKAVPPEGFAPFDGNAPFRAVSAEGVSFKVRHTANDPEAPLKFWSEALKKRMDNAGYTVLGDTEIEAGGVPGYVLELAAPLGQRDFAYLVGIFVVGRNLVIVESAGEVTHFKARRDAILTAMRQLQLG